MAMTQEAERTVRLIRPSPRLQKQQLGRTRDSTVKQSTNLLCKLDRMLRGTAFMSITHARVVLLDDMSARVALVL